MTYMSTKTYGHEVGLSCAFRQWRAKHSHCSKVHGYALAFKFVFQAVHLDSRNWVVDFGGLKSLKQELQDHFDHKLVVAKDDPFIETFLLLHNQKAAEVVVMDVVGCEAFARFAFELAKKWLLANIGQHVVLVSCEVSEHGANSAIYKESV